MVPTSEQQQKAREARSLKIYSRWLAGGRVTVVDLAEIRDLMGEEHYKRAMELLGANPEPAALANFPLGRTTHARELSEYVETLSTGERQLKRYNKKGREAEPPDLPPFDQPALMADWFVKHYPHRKVPKKFLELKLKAAQGGGESSEPGFTPIDITKLTLQKGAAVDMAARYVVAAHENLLKGYQAGNDAVIRLWQPRFYDALDALRKAEASERQAAKIRGDLVPKSQIFSDIAEFLEILRTMKETAGRRVRAVFGELSVELQDKIELTVTDEMEKQNAVLRQLPGFQSRQDLQLAMS